MKNRAWTVLGKKKSFLFFDAGEEHRFDWEIFDNDVCIDRTTGMSDCMGEIVFENDIIFTDLHYRGGPEVEEKVVFERGCFCIFHNKIAYPLHELQGMHVIGHVHDS